MDMHDAYPSLQGRRRHRPALSSPCCCTFQDLPLASPSDSGYDTIASPTTPLVKRPKDRLVLDRLPPRYAWPSVDGAISTETEPEDPWESDRDADPETTTPTGPRTTENSKTMLTPRRRMVSCAGRSTLPRWSQLRKRPALPFGFASESTLRTRSNSLQQPDRFVPPRRVNHDLAELIKTTKDLRELTATERLLRHDGASGDPFCFRRRVTAPMASDYRVISRSESGGLWPTVSTILGPLDQNSGDGSGRYGINNTVWAVGGIAPSGTAVDNGRGQLVSSGTNARLFRTAFPPLTLTSDEEAEKHQARLAKACDIDQTRRMLFTTKTTYVESVSATNNPRRLLLSESGKTKWDGTVWVNDEPRSSKSVKSKKSTRDLSSAPFKVLDAPGLRDDFYCSILAYSSTCETLAVGLGDLLYGWSESDGVRLLNAGVNNDAHLTSVAFSSVQGGKAILAFGRSDCSLALLSIHDLPSRGAQHRFNLAVLPRFDVVQPAAVACLSWKPTCTLRHSESPYNSHPDTMVPTEDLLVGDDQGIVYFFSVEWPDRWEVERFNWPGVMRLRAKISVHSQQICGLAWSADGSLFATGGNDNLCYCFESSKIINARGPVGSRRRGPLAVDVERGVVDASIRTGWPPYHINFDEPWTTEPDGTEVRRTSTDSVPHFGEGDHKQRWTHGAAVKAIAFCPWQEGLLATGGGSNDKCIHFYHSTTGTALATISVSAQVTGLIWSTTAREIAATFGYTQPEHPMRIAVFAWPACTQVASIPWAGNHRALYAVPYPSLRRPATAAAEDRRTGSVTTAPPVGSIVVAASDGSVKFHEIWPTGGRSAVGGVGMLGGSAILDCLEGIDPEGDVIR